VSAALGVIVVLLAAGNVACAATVAYMARRYRLLSGEVTELQAVADMLLLANGKPAVFAARHGLEYVLDPTKLPPPP
jgi:hypothetical protein